MYWELSHISFSTYFMYLSQVTGGKKKCSPLFLYMHGYWIVTCVDSQQGPMAEEEVIWISCTLPYLYFSSS
jgi:hypothetical protein